MNDKTTISLASIVAGLMIVETALFMGVDGAVLALGAAAIGAGVGVPIGYTISKKESP